MKLLIIIILLLLFSINHLLFASDILEKEKKQLYELYKFSGINMDYFYSSFELKNMYKIKELTKKILIKDKDYIFYRDIVYLYAFSCEGINYNNLMNNRLEKIAKNVEMLFDLEDFDKPLQWLILAQYFMFKETWGGQNIGRFKHLDSIKYLNKIIKKYPKSIYIDDAYLNLGMYYDGRAICYKRFKLSQKEADKFKKKSINTFKYVINKFPKSNSVLLAKQHLYNWHNRTDEKKAEAFINKCINEYRKQEDKKALCRLLYRKYSSIWNKESMDNEKISLLKEIYSLTEYKNLKKSAEIGLLRIYKDKKQFNKMIEIYSKRLIEAKNKGIQKDIQYIEKRINELKSITETNKNKTLTLHKQKKLLSKRPDIIAIVAILISISNVIFSIFIYYKNHKKEKIKAYEKIYQNTCDILDYPWQQKKIKAKKIQYTNNDKHLESAVRKYLNMHWLERMYGINQLAPSHITKSVDRIKYANRVQKEASDFEKQCFSKRYVEYPKSSPVFYLKNKEVYAKLKIIIEYIGQNLSLFSDKIQKYWRQIIYADPSEIINEYNKALNVCPDFFKHNEKDFNDPYYDLLSSIRKEYNKTSKRKITRIREYLVYLKYSLPKIHIKRKPRIRK